MPNIGSPILAALTAREKVVELEDDSHLAPSIAAEVPKRPDVTAVNHHLTRGRRVERAEQVEACGLPAAGGACDSDSLPWLTSRSTPRSASTLPGKLLDHPGP